ncbi:MAG: diguanylate cyclase [Comamonadaceae bacterium]
MKPIGQFARIQPRNVFRWLVVSWSILILVFAVWGQRVDYIAVFDGARESARESFNKDVVYRRWAATLGFMYVPITPETRPNPNLSDIAERDISTPSGVKLTLMNPAYMTRQVHELGQKEFGFRGHMTSLKPLRPGNTPDEWERRALESFERGEKEVVSIDPIDGEMYFRFMRPLIAEKECLPCHEKQGYKVGEIRGGISVSLPWTPYRQALWKQFPSHLGIYGGIWIIGLFGLLYSARQIQHHLDQRKLAEDEVETSRALFQSVIDGAPASIYAHNLKGQSILVNHAFEQHFRVSRSDVLGRTRAEGLAGVMSPEVAEMNHQLDRKIIESGRVFETEELNVEADGTHIYQTLKHPLRDLTGRIFGITGISTDITDRKRIEEQVAKLNRDFISSLENTSDFVYFKDANGYFRFCSQAMANITGHASWRDMIGKHDREIFPEETAKIYNKEELLVLSTGKPLINKEEPYYDASGNQGWISTSKWPLINQEGEVEGLFGISRDITEQKKLENQIRRLAFYDPLTQLANRRLLDDRLNQAMAASKRSANYAAMMVLDLDNFKSLNDTHGHLVGDLLLVEVARRLIDCVRATDTVARFGGDEFVVMISELNTDKAQATEQAAGVAEKIRASLAAPYLLTVTLAGEQDKLVEHQCSASIGLVMFVKNEASQTELMKRADAAMYQAKDAGRNTIRICG